MNNGLNDPIRLRRLLIDAGISQLECARRIEISPRTLCSYLQTDGKYRAPFPIVCAIEKIVRDEFSSLSIAMERSIYSGSSTIKSIIQKSIDIIKICNKLQAERLKNPIK